MWRSLNIFKGPSSVANHQNLSWRYDGKTEKKILQEDRNTERRRDREEVKEVGKRGKGGGNEGGGREKCSSCTLSFKGAKNFIPGKALFLSLSGKFCKLSPLHSCCSHTHTFTQSRQTRYSPEFWPLFPLSAPCCPKWTRPNSKHSLPRSWQTRPSQQCRGGWGHRIEEVASPGMHGSRHDQTRSVWFSHSHSIPPFFSSFCLSLYLPSFILSLHFHSISSSLPPFLLLPPHALLCEGIEFISECWAGHTTTINSLSASHTHTLKSSS